jgi:hypothetical protein
VQKESRTWEEIEWEVWKDRWISGTMVSVYCDTSAGKPRPYIPAPLRLQVFQSIHNLSHPGTKARLVTQRFVWPGVQKDCRTWTRACQSCQCSKISRHTVIPLGNLRLRQPDFLMSTYTSWDHFQRQQASHTASLQSTVSPAGQKPSPSQTSQPTQWHTPY